MLNQIACLLHCHLGGGGKGAVENVGGVAEGEDGGVDVGVAAVVVVGGGAEHAEMVVGEDAAEAGGGLAGLGGKFCD